MLGSVSRCFENEERAVEFSWNVVRTLGINKVPRRDDGQTRWDPVRRGSRHGCLARIRLGGSYVGMKGE